MENEESLDAVFYALADRRRRQMLAELAAGSRPISELAACAGLNISAASKHISVLESANLITKTRHGRIVHCHINFDAWRVVASYIAMHARFWAGRLDELETYIKELEK